MPEMRLELADLGWDVAWAEAFRPFAGRNLVPARVSQEGRHHVAVFAEQGEIECAVAGRLYHAAVSKADLPHIGDWVAVIPPAASGSQGLVEAVLPRRTWFSRRDPGKHGDVQVVAANLDWLFIVESLDASSNSRRIDRFLAMVAPGGARPAIIFNKADLVKDLEPFRARLGPAATGVPIFITAANRGQGIEPLRMLLHRGVTGGFVGPSGVGKSTLANRLLGQEKQRTAEVRTCDRKGYHTTTTRSLLRLPGGGLIIDTPGMRELQLWADASPEEAFPDIETLAAACRFRDCRHQSETDCAVQAALMHGQLDADRLQSYVKLRREREAVYPNRRRPPPRGRSRRR